MHRATDGLLALGLLCASLPALGAANAEEILTDLGRNSTLFRVLHEHGVETIPLLASPLIAVVGYFVQAILEARSRDRSLKLERVSLQIKEFYGPISAFSHRSKSAFNSMLLVYASHIGCDADDPEVKDRFLGELRDAESKGGKWAEGSTSSYVVTLWTDFVRHTAYPLNKQIVEILTTQPHLFDGPFPPEILELFVLVAEREIIIRQWDRGDYSRLMFTTFYPADLDSMIDERLQELQAQRLELTRTNPLKVPSLLRAKKQSSQEPRLGWNPSHKLTSDSAGVVAATRETRPLLQGSDTNE